MICEVIDQLMIHFSCKYTLYIKMLTLLGGFSHTRTQNLTERFDDDSNL